MWRHGVVTSIVRFLCGEVKEQVEEECKENSSNKHCIVNYQPYVYVYQREGRNPVFSESRSKVLTLFDVSLDAI